MHPATFGWLQKACDECSTWVQKMNSSNNSAQDTAYVHRPIHFSFNVLKYGNNNQSDMTPYIHANTIPVIFAFMFRLMKIKATVQASQVSLAKFMTRSLYHRIPIAYTSAFTSILGIILRRIHWDQVGNRIWRNSAIRGRVCRVLPLVAARPLHSVWLAKEDPLLRVFYFEQSDNGTGQMPITRACYCEVTLNYRTARLKTWTTKKRFVWILATSWPPTNLKLALTSKILQATWKASFYIRQVVMVTLSVDVETSCFFCLPIANDLIATSWYSWIEAMRYFS